MQEKVRIALEKAIRKPRSASQTSRESKEPLEGDYLDLERTLSTPQVLEVTKQRLEELIKETSETKDNLTKEQQVIDENIKQNLESMGMTRHGPSEKVIEGEDRTERKKVSPPALMTPQPQRERVARTHVRPIGEKSIPIRYSKELGRNGGIERPTSTEARRSQNSALQTAKEFLNGSEHKTKKPEIETPVGEPQQELDWDGLQEPLSEPHTQPKESDYQTTRNAKTTPELRTKTSTQSKKRTFQEKEQNLRNKVITMPRPPFTKIYKRKVGDPSNKIYSDEGMYGDEKDDLFAKGYCGSDQEVDLFDIICERCHGDHVVMYCPYNPDGTLKQELEKQSPDRTGINVDYTVSTPCWNCNGKHYYRDCPEKEWHGQLERAREQSDDLHLSLLYNSKGYARLHHLTQQQIQAIKRSQITTEPQNSTKSPYVRVHPEREEVENSGIKFKNPPTGLRPPRKIIPPRTPKFDLGGMEQKSLTQEDVRQWVKEQNALGHKTKYIPAQTTLRDKDESPQETKGGEQRSFRKEERTPRKQANPRKLRVKENDTQDLKPVPVQTTSSQVREESLEELQSGEQITNTVYSPRIGNIKELRDTEQYLYKPEYQINGVQGVNQTINMDTREKGIYQFRDQSEYIRPVDPEVIYEREPARIAIRKKISQHEKHPIEHSEEGLGKTHPFLVKELKKPIRLQKVPGYFPTKKDWERAIKRVVASRGGRKKGKIQRTSKTSKHQSSRQEGDPPEERPPQPPRMGQGAGGGGGDDPGDPDEPDDSGLGDRQDEEDEDETETETEGEVPQEELPQSLHGQTVHRIRIPTKLMGSSSHKARKFNKPIRRGGGGNSPSPSPPPSRGGHERRKRKIPKRPRWVYMVQGPPGPPGQDGRDGRDGANAPPVPAPQQIPNTTTNLDTSALEQSFDRVGQNIVNVLTEQRLTNERLEHQFNSNNESLQEQADAMRDLADTTAKRAYDHMFAAIPIFDGTKPELFNDWLESIETLCEESGRDIRTEVMGRAGPIVQRILKSIPANKRWSIQREELRRCVSDIPTKAHAARKLQTLKQEPKENLRAFIHRFTTLHYITTNRSPEQEYDVTHIVQFLSAIRNSKISKRIAEQRIPEGMTLQELFMKALDFEAGLQMSEGVTQKRESEIFEMTEEPSVEEDLNELASKQKDLKGSCYHCGLKGHYFKDCPGKIGDPSQHPQYSEGVVGQMQHTFTTTSDITNKMMGELYKQLAAAELKSQLYRKGYRKAKANVTQPGTATIPTTITPMTAPVVTTQVPAVATPIAATAGPSMNPVVQLTRVKTEPSSTAPFTTIKRTINIPRGITNAQAYFASKSPATAVAGATTTTTTTTATRTLKGGNSGKSFKQTKATFGSTGGRPRVKKTDACQALETIPETHPELESDPLIELDVSDTEAGDLCEILDDIPTETEDEVEDIRTGTEF